jgi:hypothetical protein
VTVRPSPGPVRTDPVNRTLRLNDRTGELADGRHAGFISSSRLDGPGSFARPMAIRRGGSAVSTRQKASASLSRGQTHANSARWPRGRHSQASDWNESSPPWNKVPHNEFCFLCNRRGM